MKDPIGPMGDEPEPLEDHNVDDFDDGTRISLMSDGSLRLSLPLMPPSWPCEEGAFEDFADRLARVLDVEVQGLDKEFFAVPKPQANTVERLKSHLLELRRKYEKK